MEGKKGPNSLEKPDRMSTLLIPPSPELAEEYKRYTPAIGVKTGEEDLPVEMALDQVLFVGGNAPVEKAICPSAGMMERFRSYPYLQITREQAVVPKLTESKVMKALTMILVDYWSMSCWTCRGEGHHEFRFPYLPTDQRLQFAYRYYLHQLESNPQLSRWLEDPTTENQQGR